jgi:hypothetical protein
LVSSSFCDPSTDVYCYHTFASLLMLGAFSDEGVVFDCCWPYSAQSFSGPSPAGLDWTHNPYFTVSDSKLS